MTTVSLHTHAPVRTSIVSDYLHRLRMAFAAWRESRQVREPLSAMSGHQMMDVGLNADTAHEVPVAVRAVWAA